MKRISTLFTLFPLAIWIIGLSVPLVSAASYDVSASVPFPVPTQAATINPLLNNATVQNAAFVISGTCQSMTPSTVISVWRGSTTLGSQSCVSGTYSLQIVLAEGSNTLIVKTANVSTAYGPDSSPVTVTLKTPVASAPTTSQSPTSSASATPGATNLSPTDNLAFNNAAQTGLSIVPQAPFTVLPSNNQISFTVYISGGSNPYSVELNWGDGTTETKVVEKAGNYTFTHTYRSAGNYTIKGKVKDVLGAVTEISHSVVVKTIINSTYKSAAAKAQLTNTPFRWLEHHWVGVTIGVAAASLAGVGYVVGQSTAFHAASSSSASRTQAKVKRKSSTPKPRGKR